MKSDIGDHYEEILNAVLASKGAKLRGNATIPLANQSKEKFFARGRIGLQLYRWSSSRSVSLLITELNTTYKFLNRMFVKMPIV